MEDLHITILEQAVQIDMLTDENERLRTGLQKLNELRLSTRDMLVASINRLGAENEQLREACRLWVGYDDLDCGNEETTLGYAQALAQAYNLAIDTTRAALQPKEGEG